MGHSDKGMVRSGHVREMNRVGNDSACEAAVHGRRRVHERVLDARRHLSGICGVWYPRARDLHRFSIAIARAIVNDYGLGGTVFESLCLVCWFFDQMTRRVPGGCSELCDVVWTS